MSSDPKPDPEPRELTLGECCLHEASTPATLCSCCGRRLELASLQVQRGADRGALFALKPRSYSLGRSRACDVVLRDRSVSREHARIVFDAGVFSIEDLDSAHGVYLDRSRVRRAALTDGCSIQLGSATVRFATLKSSPAEGGIETPLTLDLPGHPLDAGLEPDRETAHALAAEALDRLRLGVVLLGAKGDPILVSRSAKAILDEADGLTLGPQGLRSSDPEAARVLRKLLSEGPRGSTPGGAIVVERRPPRRPLSVLVTPLECALPGLPGPPPARAVFISDPERASATSEEVLKRLYGLTAAEANLVRELLQGRSLEEAAAALQITVHTARTHVKRVFSKTGTRRQSELVLLLLSGPGQFLHD